MKMKIEIDQPNARREDYRVRLLDRDTWRTVGSIWKHSRDGDYLLAVTKQERYATLDLAVRAARRQAKRIAAA